MESRIEVAGRYYKIDHVITSLMKARFEQLVKLHKHPVYHLIYILEGRGFVTIGPTTTEAKPGYLYIINPNEPHEFHFGAGLPLTNLECTFQMLDEEGQAAEVNFFDLVEINPNITISGPIRMQPILVPSRFQPMLTEGYGRILDLYGSPLLRNQFGIMIADLMARVETIVLNAVRTDDISVPVEELIENIKEFITANQSRALTLNEVAEFAHFTPNYLCRIFKRHTGMSPMKYLQTVRIEGAKKLLSLTDLPVYTIAEKMGINEPSYFARMFRSTYGISPQTYRNQIYSENRIK